MRRARDGLRDGGEKASSERTPGADVRRRRPDLHAAADERPAPDDEGRPRPRSRKRRTRKKRPARNRRALFGRIAYWSLVVGLWLAIGGVGMVAWVGAHLPPIQSLEIPKRPPSIQIVDMQGRALARRGDLAGEPLPLKEMPGYVPKAFVAIEDRRFTSITASIRSSTCIRRQRSTWAVAQGGSTISQQLIKIFS
jgi:penicillin-binding protein 1A